MCDNGKYGPVGYQLSDETYCMDSTADIARDAHAKNEALRALFPSGKRTMRDDNNHATLFLRNKIIAKRYDKRGRMISKHIISHKANAVLPECQGAECMLDMWASIVGIANRRDQGTYDSNNFPKPIMYHDACQRGCDDLGCEGDTTDHEHHETCDAKDCGVDICNP